MRQKKLYKPPAYHVIHKSLLDIAWHNIQNLEELKTKSSIHKYDCTICSAGWENVIHRPLMNVMKLCLTGDVLFGFIDTTDNTKDTNYAISEVKDILPE